MTTRDPNVALTPEELAQVLEQTAQAPWYEQLYQMHKRIRYWRIFAMLAFALAVGLFVIPLITGLTWYNTGAYVDSMIWCALGGLFLLADKGDR